MIPVNDVITDEQIEPVILIEIRNGECTGRFGGHGGTARFVKRTVRATPINENRNSPCEITMIVGKYDIEMSVFVEVRDG